MEPAFPHGCLCRRRALRHRDSEAMFGAVPFTPFHRLGLSGKVPDAYSPRQRLWIIYPHYTPPPAVCQAFFRPGGCAGRPPRPCCAAFEARPFAAAGCAAHASCPLPGRTAAEGRLHLPARYAAAQRAPPQNMRGPQIPGGPHPSSRGITSARVGTMRQARARISSVGGSISGTITAAQPAAAPARMPL